jgi:spore maturation protein CgeB
MLFGKWFDPMMGITGRNTVRWRHLNGDDFAITRIDKAIVKEFWIWYSKAISATQEYQWPIAWLVDWQLHITKSTLPKERVYQAKAFDLGVLSEMT